MSQEDQSYARAIEESLHASIVEDTYEDLLPEDRVRQAGRCVDFFYDVECVNL